MLLRNDQHMNRSLRIQIMEAYDLIIFVHFVGRDLSCRYFTKIQSLIFSHPLLSIVEFSALSIYYTWSSRRKQTNVRKNTIAAVKRMPARLLRNTAPYPGYGIVPITLPRICFADTGIGSSVSLLSPFVIKDSPT